MLKKNRLKNIDIRFFIIPFTLILLLFTVISYQSVNNHINRTYDIVERQSISIAESYTRRVINAQESTEIITELLDDKLLIASEAILGTENKNDNGILKSLAQKYHVDEIYLYDNSGEIINSADEDLIGWKANPGHPDVKIAVNISGIQLLRDEFIDIVKYCVQDSQIDYKCLEFEITESILVEKNELVNQKLEELKNLGITLALDDFGTGYSSFAELSDLKTDTIKIDRVFIEKIGRQIHRNYITGDIIAMAHKLGLTVVAEGVENEEQRDYLKKYECDIIQGYYFSKPLAPADVLELLKNHKVSG